MKFFILICFILFQMSAIAQDAIIAVGEAQQDKDKLVIDDAELASNLTGDQKRLSAELVEIIRNDFVFYRHKFNPIDYAHKGKSSFTFPDLNLWQSSAVNFFITSRVENGPGSSIDASFKVWSVLKKTEIYDGKFKVSNKNLRQIAHQIADNLYKSITGKSSIFNSKIFFISDRTSEKDIEKELYLMDFDGRRVDKLTNFNSVVLSPSVSPDNSKVMFSLIASKKEVSRSKVRMIKNIDLKMMDLRTKALSTISDRPGINSGAIFSKNPDVIYLTLSFSGNADIYEMNLKSRQMKKITNHYADDVDPSVTLTGSFMAFLSNRAGRAHIYTMDPSDTEKNVKRISFVGQFNATPRFSPDGREIVFTSWVDNSFDLYRIGADGNNLVRLTKDFGSNEEPSYSPDGEFIIFSSKRVSGGVATQDIYLMNREGEILGQLTQGFGHCLTPRWTNL
jgi:TolB protein